MSTIPTGSEGEKRAGQAGAKHEGGMPAFGYRRPDLRVGAGGWLPIRRAACRTGSLKTHKPGDGASARKLSEESEKMFRAFAHGLSESLPSHAQLRFVTA